MANAKVIIRQQDRSAIVPSLSGISIGTVVDSKWGPIEPKLVTTPTKLVDFYYKPDNKKGSSWNGAELLLANSNSVYISRAIHDDARYAASLVRYKIETVDFNSFPQPDAQPDLIVKPIENGISLEGIETYNFPQYTTEREYEDLGIKALWGTSYEDGDIEVNLLGNNNHQLQVGDRISFGDVSGLDNNSDFFTVLEAGEKDIEDRVLVLDSQITASVGDELKYFDTDNSTWESFDEEVYLIRDVIAGTNAIVTNHDLVINGMQVSFDDGVTQAEVTDKNLNIRSAFIIVIDSEDHNLVAEDEKITWMKANEFEYRDAFLVTAKYPGDLGKQIKVGIRASKNYDEAFFVDVYFKGALQESFEVTRDQFLDGFGNQMEIETVINSRSAWINIKNNPMVDNAELPLVTDYGVWRRNNWDIFNPVGVFTIEDIVKDDVFFTVDDTGSFVNGDRIRLGSQDSEEYKILNIVGNDIQVDRPFVQSKVALGVEIYKFDEGLNDPANGVFNGSQYYKFSKVAPTSEFTIGDQQTISNDTGIVLDAGWNNQAGGSDGSAVTLFDVINAFKKMDNKEKYNISIFCDNGFAYPEVAIAIDEVCKKTNLSHGFISTPYATELSNNPAEDCVAYRNSTNLNTEYVSMFTGWIKVTDVYNQTRVFVAPSIFGVNAQSFVTRNYQIFTPAAGWAYGRLNGLDITYKFDDGERDLLDESQINVIRYREGMGLVVWGNETLYVKPSPLQLRSVAMLLIVLKYGLENYLEFKLFALNNEPTWTEVESAIDIFIRDEIYTPGGLYGYQVAVQDIITDSDIDNRRMPVIINIQPTMDIKSIPVTIGIFNRSVEMSF